MFPVSLSLLDYRIFMLPGFDRSAGIYMYRCVPNAMVCADHLFTKQTLITSFHKLNQSPAHLFHCLLFLLLLNLFFMSEIFFIAKVYTSLLCWCAMAFTVCLCGVGAFMRSDLFNVQKHIHEYYV